MTPELVARVDACLARRSGSALSCRWSLLASTWADQQISALSEDAEATAAAMSGVLLAIVREAWGIPGLSIASHPSAVVELWRVLAHGEVLRIGGLVGFVTEAAALVAALEAASSHSTLCAAYTAGIED